MPANDDYAAANLGGLRLKGVKNSRVDKQKKKKQKKDKRSSSPNKYEQRSFEDEKDKGVAKDTSAGRGEDAEDKPSEADGRSEDDHAVISKIQSSKTEAEKRHEERRRKRLDDRLKREGTKTHKERVEDLNRYLSALTEHHDMPRIGPG